VNGSVDPDLRRPQHGGGEPSYGEPELWHAGDCGAAGLGGAGGVCGLAPFAGTNPSIATVSRPLADREFARHPTGATLVCDFAVETWAEAGFGMATVVDFVVPRELVG
jgi:phosphohistidine phosphatase